MILRRTTDPGWLPLALSRFDEVLVDHAHCAKKAAANALSMLQSYPEIPELPMQMARLAREESAHLAKVLAPALAEIGHGETAKVLTDLSYPLWDLVLASLLVGVLALADRPTLLGVCALLAALWIVIVMYGLPGALVDAGADEATMTWGAYLALAGCVTALGAALARERALAPR